MHRRQVLKHCLSSIAIVGAPTIAHASSVPLRISVDTAPTLSRNVWLERFASLVAERSKGRIDPKVFHSGQLFRDNQVANALRLGSVDMAVPGVWVLGGVDTRMDLQYLPMFSGQPRSVHYQFSDGKFGQDIDTDVARKLNSQRLGRRWDNGPVHLFVGAKEFRRNTDFKGMKIRYPGAAGMALWIEAMGGQPLLVPWTDVPLGMSRGNFDALVSTADSILGVKLWESGVKTTYANYMVYNQYLPMVSNNFWGKLPNDLQKVMTDTWEELVDGERTAAFESEESAVVTLETHGVRTVRPSPTEVAAERALLMKQQDRYVETLKLDPALVKAVGAAIKT